MELVASMPEVPESRKNLRVKCCDHTYDINMREGVELLETIYGTRISLLQLKVADEEKTKYDPEIARDEAPKNEAENSASIKGIREIVSTDFDGSFGRGVAC